MTIPQPPHARDRAWIATELRAIAALVDDRNDVEARHYAERRTRDVLAAIEFRNTQPHPENFSE
jgi:hypothetical protein